MSSSEFTAWQAYDVLEPFGAQRDNLHAGIIATAVYAASPKKFDRVSAQDFLVQDAETHKQKRLSQFIGALRGLAKPKGKTNGS